MLVSSSTSPLVHMLVLCLNAVFLSSDPLHAENIHIYIIFNLLSYHSNS